MANTCPCGRRGIDPSVFRTIMDPIRPDLFWYEWDAECPNGCGDEPTIELTNAQTDETRVFSLNEAWELFGGQANQVGLMQIPGLARG
ncbi:hypothetical protein KC571_03690 [candidate division WWE3 bacterium]|uniref:Uncharacterized protein n=1 Tax=candidate division WWE3 bacterium TaxID=2053526 RepID=A0A955LHA5_UNCKA|nr:hypothetical protein [candidate division WWE3 bacterium]